MKEKRGVRQRKKNDAFSRLLPLKGELLIQMMDSIGTLPVDKNGSKYILTVICCFTRWVSLYPLKDRTAKSCAECLLQHDGTFGRPHRIVMDNGTQFKNELVEKLLKLLRI